MKTKPILATSHIKKLLSRLFFCAYLSALTLGLSAEPGKSLILVGSNKPPSVNIWTPKNGQVIPTHRRMDIRSGITDPDGWPTQVVYSVDGISIGKGTGMNWGSAWIPTNSGKHILTAVATDNRGVTSAVRSVEFEATNLPPQIIWLDPDPGHLQGTLEPVNGAVVSIGSTNTFLLQIDGFFAVERIEMLVNGEKQINAGLFPYSIWIPTHPGTYRLQLVAIDRADARLASDPVTITVANVTPPTVAILSPTNNATFLLGSPVSIRAKATDLGASITNMMIAFEGRKWLRPKSSTIDVTVSNLSSGWHQAEVSAANNHAQRKSEWVNFFVTYESNASLPTPGGFGGKSTDWETIALHWDVPAQKRGAGWVAVEQKQGNGKWEDIGGCDINDAEFLPSELKADTEYWFRMTFLDKNQQRSAYSPVIMVRTLPNQ